MPIPTQHFAQPVVVPHENSILFLAETWATTTVDDITIEVVRSPGFLIEAVVRNTTTDEILFKERIDMSDMLTDWLQGLLVRAGKEV